MSNQHSNINQSLSIHFSELASALGVVFENKSALSALDVKFSGLSINTRTIKKGDVFVALKGENFDAHNFIKQAEEQGACGLIVERKVASELPQLIVTDTRMALGKIALLWRQKFTLPVIAITGSCGKTTVKEMTSSILRCAFSGHGSVLATLGNLNNDIGVPLTLMRLNTAHKAAVIEIGANHQGEISQLVKLVQPDVALITNAAHAHIEGFGSIEGVAQAKSEIYSDLALRDNTQGIAIINADDKFAHQWIKCNEQAESEGRVKVVTFGLNNTADVSAHYQQKEDGIELKIKTSLGVQLVSLNLFGQHNIYNALAATAASIAIGCSLADVKDGLESFSDVSGRFERKTGLHGSLIFDDTYNANPGSVKAGIDALKQIAGQQNTENKMVLILGDMGELGDESKQLHYQLGSDIADLGIEQLLTVGDYTRETHQAYCAQVSGLNKGDMKAVHFDNKQELIDSIKEQFHDNELILVKGSRSMAMESVVSAMEVAH